MVLDRALLAQYVGDDADFEAQYLALLKETVAQCLSELKLPSSRLHAVLHAAKPGIVVAVTADVAALFSLACDLTVDPKNQAFSDEALKTLAELFSHLEILLTEVISALQPNA